MKLYVSKKTFSIQQKFYVKDENNLTIYEISNQTISIGDKITINDIQGNKIVYIAQELFHFIPIYNIFINDKCICQMTRKPKFFKSYFSLSNGYKVTGNARETQFTIYDNQDKEIGYIKHNLLSIKNKYEINIINTENKEIILAILSIIANEHNKNTSD